MNHFNPRLTLLLRSLFLSCILCACGSRVAGGPPENAKWEYAELRSTFIYEYEDGKKTASQAGVYFDTGDEELKAADYAKIAKSLGKQLKHNNSTCLLNALAGDGWELLTHAFSQGSNAAGDVHSFGNAIISTTSNEKWNMTDVWTLRRAIK